MNFSKKSKIMNLKINTIEDVRTFFGEIINERVNIHPDDDFKSIINIKTGSSTFTEEEAELHNKLMDKCFEVCEQSGVDIYNLAMEVDLKKTGLDQLIPLP